MKKRFLIVIFILVSVFFISNDLFARRSGGRSGGRSFSSRRSSSSYSGSSRSSYSSSSRNSYSGTKRKGTGYYDPNHRRVGNYVQDDGSDFLFYIISLIVIGILWFIYNIAGGKEFIKKYVDKFFKKADDLTWSDETIISFSLLIDKLDFDLKEKIYFFNPDVNVRIHKILQELVENSDKILKFTNLKLEKDLKFDETQQKVNKIKEDYENLTSDDPNGELYLVSIVASYTPKLEIEEKENYTKEDYQNILQEMLKLNKYFLFDNVKHSNVTINKVKSDFDFL